MTHLLSVLVHTPAHSQVDGPLTYRSELALSPGTLVRVPLGKREILGVVWDAPSGDAPSTVAPEKLRAIAGVLDGIDPLTPAWRQLLTFAASYYQRSAGEVALTNVTASGNTAGGGYTTELLARSIGPTGAVYGLKTFEKTKGVA